MALHREILEAVALGKSLKRVAGELCRGAEAMTTGTSASILAVNSDGTVKTLAAPSLPAVYSRAINGLSIGPEVGSCGTAAFTGKPVVVTDIATDPLWKDFRVLALPLGLRACWSSPIFGADGRVVGTFAFYFDTPRGPTAAEQSIVRTCARICAIAFAQDESREKLKQLAYTDALTGLPNRAAFLRRSEKCLAPRRLRGSEARSAIFCLDLDGFKQVNDILGHGAGDLLLAAAGARLRECVGGKALVARMGGDEFAILQPRLRQQDDITRLAARVIDAFTAPFEIDGRDIRIGCSLGSACAPRDGGDPETLLNHADFALYEAKRLGRNRHVRFDPAHYARQCSVNEAEAELRGAVARRELEIHYQPVIDLRSQRITGQEALARWRHPVKGLVQPSDFIPLAEKSGLILEIGAFVLEQACADARLWPEATSVAVNVSALQLREPGFALRVARTLAATGLAPSRLEIEITETALLSDETATRNTLVHLRGLGVHIAIDDFGTGYSALSYLRAFPVDRIKIDRSFVTDMIDAPRDRSIVRAIIALANELGMRTTAEGIETEQQLACLRDIGCCDGQGFLFGRPQPIDVGREAQVHAAKR